MSHIMSSWKGHMSHTPSPLSLLPCVVASPRISWICRLGKHEWRVWVPGMRASVMLNVWLLLRKSRKQSNSSDANQRQVSSPGSGFLMLTVAQSVCCRQRRLKDTLISPTSWWTWPSSAGRNSKRLQFTWKTQSAWEV